MAEAEVAAISQEEMLARSEPRLRECGRRFKKTKRSMLRPASAGEEVVTVIGGVEETRNVAGEGDWVVANDTPSQEMYILTAAKAEKNYDLASGAELGTEVKNASALADAGFKWYSPKGVPVLALQVEAGDIPPGGHFLANWGTPMLLEPGDYLVARWADEQEAAFTEVYRVEREAFEETFGPA